LEQAYIAALGHDPKYRSSIQTYAIGQEYAVQARASLLPRVVAGANTGANRNKVSMLDSDQGYTEVRSYTNNSTSISIQQPLFNLGAIMAYKEGLIQTAQSGAVFDSSRNELALRTVGAYTAVLLARDNLAAKQAEYDSLEEQAKSTKMLAAAGEATATDISEVLAQLELVDSDLLEAKDDVENADRAFSMIVGEPAKVLNELSQDLCYGNQLPSLASLEQLALAHNGEIRVARSGVEIARLEVARTKAQYAPTVMMEAGVSRARSDSLTTYKERNSGGYVAVQMKLPLFEGGATTSASRQSSSAYLRAQSDLDDRIASVFFELGRTYRALNTDVSRIKALKKSIEYDESLIKATASSIKAGYRLNLDLINAKKQLADNRSGYARARYDYINSALKLRTLTGMLDATDITRASGCFR
jgi:protease secretion system outer membrane protein